MQTISFPSNYKKALINKTKSITIRPNQFGKYKVGKIYIAKSYSDNLWNIKIKILEINYPIVGTLSEYGIPKRSINSFIKKTKCENNQKVMLIKFKVI
ncbi:MAG: hypothetical protein V1824_03465 [archaeon]